jgi:hypothetical protein
MPRGYRLIFVSTKPHSPRHKKRGLTFAFTFFVENDVVIIGGGPGGYVAAIKAAQLGLKVRSFFLSLHNAPKTEAGDPRLLKLAAV